MNPTNVADALVTARSIIKKADYCFFITHGANGESNARLMHPFEPDGDFNIWFGASPSSRKVREVTQHNKVTLTFLSPTDTAYTTILGTATIENSETMKQKYWRAYWSDMYPGGPEADEYILIKVEPYKIELMNFAKSVLPQPYGLKPFGIGRKGTLWSIITSGDEL